MLRANSSWMPWWVKPTTSPAAEALTIAEQKLNADLNAAVNTAHRVGCEVVIKEIGG